MRVVNRWDDDPAYAALSAGFTLRLHPDIDPRIGGRAALLAAEG